MGGSIRMTKVEPEVAAKTVALERNRRASRSCVRKKSAREPIIWTGMIVFVAASYPPCRLKTWFGFSGGNRFGARPQIALMITNACTSIPSRGPR